MRASQLPNLITILRLAAVPVLILFLKDERFAAALVLFIAAGFSDALDGYIAKRWNYITRLGAILDPLADKLMLVSTYVMLAWLDALPFWLVLAVVSRDALIVGGYLVYTTLYGPVQMRPSVYSKLNTLAQISLVVAVLAHAAALIAIPWVVAGLVWFVLATTVGSGLHYVWVWLVLKEVRQADERGGRPQRRKKP
jgi:cardiolipin synthase